MQDAASSPDTDLMRRAAAGDRDAFETLYRTHHATVYRFARLMTGTKFSPLPSYGSYFQLYKYDRISDEADKDFAIRITKEYGVASIPVSAFYQSGKDDRVVRFCFAKKAETLEKAAERLQKIK